jgi:hypothetical protein
MKLYQLSGEYRLLQEAADDGADVSAALAALTDALEIKAENIARLLRNMESDEDGLAAESKRLSERKSSLVAQRKKLREYLRSNMEACGITRIKTPAFTISLANNPEKVEIKDAREVPAQYTRLVTNTEIDEAAILRAYKDHGECVPGTEITRTTSIRIK